MKKFSLMRRVSLMLIALSLLGGCINVTIDPTKPIEVHAVVDVNVKATDKKPPDVFGDSDEKPAAAAEPVAKPAKP